VSAITRLLHDINASLDDALASTFDAGATRVPPWMAIVAALASVQPDGIDATIDWLVAHKRELAAAYDGGCDGKLGVAKVPPEMEYTEELGFLDRAKNDVVLRDRYLFADVIGQRGFFQTAVYAMTGIELPARDAEMLDQIGNATLQPDRRAWPMAVTRRVGARGGGYQAAVLAGFAMMGAPMIAGEAAASCARFLMRAQAADRPVAELVVELLARKERVMGFGRPAVGPDERVPVMQAILRQYGRDALPYVSTLRAAEAAFVEHKGLSTTAAAWAAAILLDYGMTPEHVHAVSNYWVAVAVYAQAVFSGERGLAATAT
jgi:hypothetical protein